MTQVWMIRNSDTDIHLFNRREHLEPSVKFSYHACDEVVITCKGELDKLTFTVTGKRGNGEGFTDIIEAVRLPVWTEPSHL